MEQLCTTLGIQRPVLAAPMAAISGGRLAAAVTAAGGLGMIGAGYGDLDWLASQARLVTPSRFGIGVITWSMGERTLDAVLALHPDAVWLSFGDPYEHVGVIHDAGTIAICQVGTIEEAAEAAAAGADVIVAQGKEAGGHGRLTMPVLEFVGATAPVVAPIPVVAAGGISDRADLDTVLAAGGAGVALGTALYGTFEALDTDAAKQRLVAAVSTDTIVSTVYDVVRGPEWPDGYVGRSLRTHLTDRWAGRESRLRQEREPIQRLYAEAVEANDVDTRVGPDRAYPHGRRCDPQVPDRTEEHDVRALPAP